MDTIIARYKEILKSHPGRDSTLALYDLMDEGVSFDDACAAAQKAFSGKAASRTRDSITTTAW